MSSQIDLKQLERQAFKATFQDGLWDIFLGLLLLLMAMGPWLSQLGWSEARILVAMTFYAGALVLAFKVTQKRIITPRLGLVNFGAARQKQKQKLTLLLSLSILLGVIVLAVLTGLYATIATGKQGAPASGELALFILFALTLTVSVVAFSCAGYLLDFPRAYLYGWFYGLAFPGNIALAEFFGVTLPLVTLLFAAIMIGIGLVLFTRFLAQYPLPQSGSPDTNHGS